MESTNWVVAAYPTSTLHSQPFEPTASHRFNQHFNTSSLPRFSLASLPSLTILKIHDQLEDIETKHPAGVAPDHPPTRYPMSMPAFSHKSTQHPHPKFPSESVFESISTLYLMVNVEATGTKFAREASLAIEIFKDGHPALFEKHSPLLSDMSILSCYLEISGGCDSSGSSEDDSSIQRNAGNWEGQKGKKKGQKGQ